MNIKIFQENLDQYKSRFDKGLTDEYIQELVSNSDFEYNVGVLTLEVKTPKEDITITWKIDSNEIGYSKNFSARSYKEFKNEEDFLDVVQSILVELCN